METTIINIRISQTELDSINNYQMNANINKSELIRKAVDKVVSGSYGDACAIINDNKYKYFRRKANPRTKFIKAKIETKKKRLLHLICMNNKTYYSLIIRNLILDYIK